MGKGMKSNKAVLERLQKLPEEGKKNTDYLFRGFHNGYDKESRELQGELERLKGKNPRGAGRKQKLTKEQKDIIRKERAGGATIAELAAKNGCSVGLVHRIVSEAND